jgi:Scavenger receptor cysteine-rich domain
MDNLHCNGDEKNLSTCRFDGWGISDCESSEAAGVVCLPNESETTPPPTKPPKVLRPIQVQRFFHQYLWSHLTQQVCVVIGSGETTIKDPSHWWAHPRRGQGRGQVLTNIRCSREKLSQPLHFFTLCGFRVGRSLRRRLGTAGGGGHL